MLHSHTTPPAFLSLTHLYPSTPTVDHTKPLAFGFSPSPHHFPSLPPVLHGGPGAGCWPNHARFFDPAAYRIVLCDQRGAGKSTPAGCVVDNRTELLVGDMEAVREHLKVGGGAGRQLGHNTSAGIRTGAPGESGRHGAAGGVPAAAPRNRLGGAEALFPFAWRDLMAALPAPAPTHTEGDADDGSGVGDGNGTGDRSVVGAFYERLMSTDPAARDSAVSHGRANTPHIMAGLTHLTSWQG
ncbi:unnamed protein product [Closterium sp. Naga37s-1]|nr:unnamed protein product [Closterium sp. Naga37s-1]